MPKPFLKSINWILLYTYRISHKKTLVTIYR